MAKMWKWIPKSEKPKSPIEKVDVMKEEALAKSNVEKEIRPNNNRAATDTTTSSIQPKNQEFRVTDLSIQSKLLIAADARECFESSLGEKYVDTGTYF